MGELKLNPKIYPLDVIYSAAYVFLDRAYIKLDGDPEKEIVVNIEGKKGEDLDKEFMNELVNYGDYKNRAKETKKVRELRLK